MNKIISLIKASMTSDMSLFKIKTKGGKSQTIIPILIALYLMFMIWGSANSIFEKFAPLEMSYILLSLFAFSVSIMTFIEGIYKTGSLMFNCKDDQLLLSLPIKRGTVLFIRIFKFYVFELLFNSLFLLPIMVAYIRWDNTLTWTYYLTCVVMLLMLPIIPIVLSCIVGTITTGLSSRFKYKNAAQIVFSMLFLVAIMYFSFTMDGLLEYIMANASSISDIITKIYYPAGIFAKLVVNFEIKDLLIFIFINIAVFALAIFVLSKFYFKINSRMESVTTSKKTKIKDLKFNSHSQTLSLIKKELNTFFKNPVFIINAGFALVLYVIMVLVITIKFDSAIAILTDPSSGLNITKDFIINNIPIMIYALISLTAYMTSITNSVISLEGRNISILKSLPINTKTILMSKIYSSLVITTPVLLIGNMILFIKFKTSVMECILLILLSILIPLVSHFIGLIVNLKYPKLDWENAAEVVKQSTSSFIAVMIGMILLIITGIIVSNVVGIFDTMTILLVSTIVYIAVDLVLYLYLTKTGVKEFNKLSI